MKINLKVYRWFGSVGFPRSNVTTINVLQQSSRANQSNNSRPRNKKKGRGGRGRR